MEKTPKGGLIDRIANLSEKIHFAVGGVALVGYFAENAANVAVVRPETLALIGGLAIAYGVGIRLARHWWKNRGKGLAVAPA